MMHFTWEQAVQWLREQPDQQELVRDCYYDDPLLAAAKRFAASAEWQATLKLLPRKPGKALDIGAGRGISSYALAMAGWTVTALEPDPSSLVGIGAIQSLVNETHLPITPVMESGELLNFADGTFDLVYARQALHHASHLPTFCEQAARVLKSGGWFIACREHVISRKSDLEIFLNGHPLHHLYGGENAYLLSDYVAAIEAGGLSLRKMFGYYDSAINYFPQSRQNIVDTVRKHLAGKIGTRTVRLFLHERWPWTEYLNMILVKRASRKLDTPGRMYTFVCFKPKSRIQEQ